MALRSLLLLMAFVVGCSSASERGPSQGSSPSESPEPIIVDSDGAVFWDDGTALAMLLQHPEKVDILGITTVIGNHWPYQAAEYLARVLKAAHRTEIPIYVGTDTPLKNSAQQLKKLESALIAQGKVPGSGFWKGAYSRNKVVRSFQDIEPVKGETLTGIRPQSKPAAEFITDTLIHAKRPVTVVAIGPLTNLAMALRRNPDISKNIRRILIMGGAIFVPGNTTPRAELNFLIDPDAANVVLSSAIPEKLLFPLDLSNQAILNDERYQDLIKIATPYSRFLAADRGPKFSDPSYSVPSWDTTVAAYVIDPRYITDFKPMHLHVSTRLDASYGSVQLNKKRSPEVRVMTKMDVERFFRILKADLASQPAPVSDRRAYTPHARAPRAP